MIHILTKKCLKFGGGNMYYMRENEYEEDEVYNRAIRGLLLEDDEIDENEEAFMEGYEEMCENCGCKGQEDDY